MLKVLDLILDVLVSVAEPLGKRLQAVLASLKKRFRPSSITAEATSSESLPKEEKISSAAEQSDETDSESPPFFVRKRSPTVKLEIEGDKAPEPQSEAQFVDGRVVLKHVMDRAAAAGEEDLGGMPLHLAIQRQGGAGASLLRALRRDFLLFLLLILVLLFAALVVLIHRLPTNEAAEIQIEGGGQPGIASSAATSNNSSAKSPGHSAEDDESNEYLRYPFGPTAVKDCQLWCESQSVESDKRGICYEACSRFSLDEFARRITIVDPLPEQDLKVILNDCQQNSLRFVSFDSDEVWRAEFNDLLDVFRTEPRVLEVFVRESALQRFRLFNRINKNFRQPKEGLESERKLTQLVLLVSCLRANLALCEQGVADAATNWDFLSERYYRKVVEGLLKEISTSENELFIAANLTQQLPPALIELPIDAARPFRTLRLGSWAPTRALSSEQIVTCYSTEGEFACTRSDFDASGGTSKRIIPKIPSPGSEAEALLRVPFIRFDKHSWVRADFHDDPNELTSCPVLTRKFSCLKADSEAHRPALRQKEAELLYGFK